ncbi:MAG: hypothetical protein AAFR70_11415 [Pseudomonadota bacterium]
MSDRETDGLGRSTVLIGALAHAGVAVVALTLGLVFSASDVRALPVVTVLAAIAQFGVLRARQSEEPASPTDPSRLERAYAAAGIAALLYALGGGIALQIGVSQFGNATTHNAAPNWPFLQGVAVAVCVYAIALVYSRSRPENTGTLLEQGGAIRSLWAGLAWALVTLAGAFVGVLGWQLPVVDGLAAIVIGAIAIGLAVVTLGSLRPWLKGQPVPSERRNGIRDVIVAAAEHDPRIMVLHDLKVIDVTGDAMAIILDVEFEETATAAAVADAQLSLRSAVRLQFRDVTDLVIQVRGPSATKPRITKTSAAASS